MQRSFIICPFEQCIYPFGHCRRSPRRFFFPSQLILLRGRELILAQTVAVAGRPKGPKKRDLFLLWNVYNKRHGWGKKERETAKTVSWKRKRPTYFHYTTAADAGKSGNSRDFFMHIPSVLFILRRRSLNCCRFAAGAPFLRDWQRGRKTRI